MDAESYKILEADMEGKGVSVQSNPMELPEAEAKAVFDQLVKEVVVPKFNGVVDALGAIDLTPDEEKPISTPTQAALDLKVDKERKTGSLTEDKVLSDNNYSDGELQKVAAAELARHTHGNKAVLDEITEKDLGDWRGGNVLTKDNTIPYEPVGQYNPATVGYVNKTVVNIGAADMTKAVYDPNGKQQDVYAYADAVALDAKVMTDDATGEGYVMGMNDGALYCAGVEAGAGQVNVARQDTLLETEIKIDAVQTTANEILQKPSSGGGQIVFPSVYKEVFYFPSNLRTSTHYAGDFYYFANSTTTYTGVNELHHISTGYGTPIHEVIYLDGREKEILSANLPRNLYKSSGSCCGNKNSKSFHFIGGNLSADNRKHSRFDVKTRIWTDEELLPYAFAGGNCSCGESFNGNLTEQEIGNIFYFLCNGSGNYLYRFDDDLKTYTIVRSGSTYVRGTRDVGCMIYNHSSGKILVCGGNDGAGTTYANFSVISISESLAFSTIASPRTLPQTTYSSCGCLCYKDYSERYFFNGITLSNVGFRNSTGTNYGIYQFINDNTTFILTTAGYTLIPLYSFSMYLPKGTKIYPASYVLSAPSPQMVQNSAPYFPELRIKDDCFVVDSSGVYSYCTYSQCNFNDGKYHNSDNSCINGGIFFEIGSGE